MIRRFVLALLFCSVPLLALAAPQAALDEEEVEFIRLINEYRRGHGLGCLAPSPTLNAAADYMSRAMGEENFFSHNEPPCAADRKDCSGRDPEARVRAHGHGAFTTLAENIAGGMSSAAAAFESWRNSPGHNANMLTAGFTAIGVGRVHVPGSRLDWYWTTAFSDRVDGPWDCEPPFEPIEEDPIDEEIADQEDEGGGCAAARGSSGLSGLVGILALLLLRRR